MKIDKDEIQNALKNLIFHPVKPPAIESNLPYVTHVGILKIGKTEIEVCQLNTGERIIEESEIMKLFEP